MASDGSEVGHELQLPPEGRSALVRRFVEALLGGERGRALELAQRAASHGVDFLYEDVIRRALEEIGRLWRSGEISVADEHVATAIAQAAIASLYPDFPWPIGGPRAIVACVETERHELGARMVADLLALDGWDAIFVGADTPRADLLTLIGKHAPRFLALSVTLQDHLPAARETLGAVREAFPTLPVLVGGRALSATVASSLGAEASASSGREAVVVVRRWKA